MPVTIHSVKSEGVSSFETGLELGHALRARFGDEPLRAVVLYASVEHDQEALLRGLREAAGDVCIAGCSSQGLMYRGATIEDGYFAGAMGFGGEVRVAVAAAGDIAHDPRAKGRRMKASLVQQLGDVPRVVFVWCDPLSGLDTDALLAGLDEIHTCPLAGGAASQPWGPINKTFQYAGTEVSSGSAVALALDGPFEVEIGASHGTEPIGVSCTVTRAQGNMIQELNGVPAVEIWMKTSGSVPDAAQTAMLAIGLPLGEPTPELGDYRVLTPMRIDPERGTLMMAATVPVGSQVMLHYRTLDRVLEGARALSRDLTARVGGREVYAVLGFECGARTGPFLGHEATQQEHAELQAVLAPDAPWLGMLAWGEVLPLRTGPAVVDYTLPLVCLVEP